MSRLFKLFLSVRICGQSFTLNDRIREVYMIEYIMSPATPLTLHLPKIKVKCYFFDSVSLMWVEDIVWSQRLGLLDRELRYKS